VVRVGPPGLFFNFLSRNGQEFAADEGQAELRGQVEGDQRTSAAISV
jgi:hypothetical protein